MEENKLGGYIDKAIAAASCWLKRKDRTEHPDGKFDNAGRWYPSDGEKEDCCRGIRGPSRSFPYSYLTHCRSKEHVCRLFGVSAEEFKRGLFFFEAGHH